MANKAAEYIREFVDALIHGDKNKRKRSEAESEITDFMENYGQSKLPEKEELPETPKYERLEYKERSDDELRESAESELSDYRNTGVKGIEKEMEALGEKYKTERENADKSYNEGVESTKKSYDEAKKATDNDMLRRGLARSSIAANKKAALESGEADAKARLYAEYSRQANEIESKINSLAAKREEAMSDFNLSYAARLTQRINELREARDKATAEAVKYNNTLAEKEYNAGVDKKMKESELYGEALSQRKSENELKKLTDSDYAAIYTEVAARLREMNKNDARDFVLSNPELRASVSSSYYYKLYDEFCR